MSLTQSWQSQGFQSAYCCQGICVIAPSLSAKSVASVRTCAEMLPMTPTSLPEALSLDLYRQDAYKPLERELVFDIASNPAVCCSSVVGLESWV